MKPHFKVCVLFLFDALYVAIIPKLHFLNKYQKVFVDILLSMLWKTEFSVTLEQALMALVILRQN